MRELNAGMRPVGIGRSAIAEAAAMLATLAGGETDVPTGATA